jgi:hypothetical protein
MQVYLGLKPKRKPDAAASGLAAAAAHCSPAAEDTVSHAIDLLHEEFFATGTQLKHVFTSAQVSAARHVRSTVSPPPPS